MKIACEATGLLDPEKNGVVVVDVVSLEDCSITTIRKQPFKPAHYSPDFAVRYEFFYCTSKSQMGVRLVTDLIKCDGVTALRIALHTMEALEGNTPKSTFADCSQK